MRDPHSWESTAGTPSTANKEMSAFPSNPGITLGILRALWLAVRARLLRYVPGGGGPSSCEAAYRRDEQQLATLTEASPNGVQTCGALSEHIAALRSALILRVTEQEVLHDAVRAVHARAVHMLGKGVPATWVQSLEKEMAFLMGTTSKASRAPKRKR